MCPALCCVSGLCFVSLNPSLGPQGLLYNWGLEADADEDTLSDWLLHRLRRLRRLRVLHIHRLCVLVRLCLCLARSTAFAAKTVLAVTRCHKKVGVKRKHQGYTSGSCHAGPPPGPAPGANGVTVASGEGAAAAAAAADVAVVFIHTTSSEGSDRKSLSFADQDNAMVEAVAKAQKNTVRRCLLPCVPTAFGARAVPSPCVFPLPSGL